MARNKKSRRLEVRVLERTGAPLYQERSGRRARWRVLDTWKHRLNLTLSFLDLLALSAACRWMEGHPQWEPAALRAWQHLREQLPREVAGRADRVLRQVVGPKLGARDAAPSEWFGRPAEALQTDETVRLTHLKAGTRAPRAYTVDPYRLVVQSQGVYLVGWCHERQSLRTFLLDRTRRVEGTGRYFERRADVDPDAVLQGAFGPWSGRATDVRLRFARAAEPFLAPERLHQTLRLQRRADGDLDATLRVPLAPAFVRWLLAWGSEVTVLAPERLARQVREEHAKAAGAPAGDKGVEVLEELQRQWARKAGHSGGAKFDREEIYEERLGKFRRRPAER